MKPGARRMLKLRHGKWIAFAEIGNEVWLLALRKTDPRMKGGRITEVLQCAPSSVEEGVVYEETKC